MWLTGWEAHPQAGVGGLRAPRAKEVSLVVVPLDPSGARVAFARVPLGLLASRRCLAVGCRPRCLSASWGCITRRLGPSGAYALGDRLVSSGSRLRNGMGVPAPCRFLGLPSAAPGCPGACPPPGLSTGLRMRRLLNRQSPGCPGCGSPVGLSPVRESARRGRFARHRCRALRPWSLTRSWCAAPCLLCCWCTAGRSRTHAFLRSSCQSRPFVVFPFAAHSHQLGVAGCPVPLCWLRPPGANRWVCSARAVSHDLGGLLPRMVCGLVASRFRPWGWSGFGLGCVDVRLACPRCGRLGVIQHAAALNAARFLPSDRPPSRAFPVRAVA